MQQTQEETFFFFLARIKLHEWAESLPGVSVQQGLILDHSSATFLPEESVG